MASPVKLPLPKAKAKMPVKGTATERMLPPGSTAVAKGGAGVKTPARSFMPMGNQLAGRTANKTVAPIGRSAAGKAALAAKPANTTARNRRVNAAATSASGPQGPVGYKQRPVGENSRMAARALPKPPAKAPSPPGLLDQIGKAIGDRVNYITNSKVPGLDGAPHPGVIPYTQQNLRNIKNTKR